MILSRLSVFLLSSFFLWIHASQTFAQQRFRAGAVFGLNASQIQGDDVGGYDKLGLLGGLRATTFLKEKLDLSFELLYTQRGSYSKYGSPRCNNGNLLIALQYVEVPVVLTYKEWLSESDDFYRIHAGAGFSYGRLINAKSEGSCHDDLTDLFNTNDFSFTAGVEYFISRPFSFGIRWTRSINLLFNKDKHDGLQGRNSLRGYFISFRGAYTF